MNIRVAVAGAGELTLRAIVGPRDKRRSHTFIDALVAVLWLLRRLDWREFPKRNSDPVVVQDLLEFSNLLVSDLVI